MGQGPFRAPSRNAVGPADVTSTEDDVMTTRMPHLAWHGAEPHGPELALAGAAAVTATAVLLATWKLPAALILPVASLVLLLAGFALALAFWQRPSPARQLSYRDVAGLLVFLGFAAALLSDTSALAPLFEAGAP